MCMCVCVCAFALFAHTQFVWTPPTTLWQRTKTADLGLQFKSANSYSRPTTARQQQPAPRRVKRIQPDGNCFFRSLSWAVTGDDNAHLELRAMLVSHMMTAYSPGGLELQQACNSTSNSMLAPGEWATEAELFGAAALLNTCICVYVTHRNEWQLFEPLSSDNMVRVYLRLECGHFEPVISISTE